MKNTFKLKVALFLFFFFFISVKTSFALEKEIVPIRDTYVGVGSASETHGFEDKLIFKRWEEVGTSFRSYVYLSFDLRDLPKNAIVENAKITLRLLNNAPEACTIHLERQRDPWNEQSNYFTLGYYSTGIYDSIYVYDDEYYSWDITQLLKDWLEEKYENNGVIMYATENCEKIFGSRDNADKTSQPKLQIQYHLPPTPTPTPIPTPTATPTIINESENISPSPTPTNTPTPVSTDSDNYTITIPKKTLLLLGSGTLAIALLATIIALSVKFLKREDHKNLKKKEGEIGSGENLLAKKDNQENKNT